LKTEFSIRDIPSEVQDWIRTDRPPGQSQNDFLVSILNNAYTSGISFDLFTEAKTPRTIFSKVPFTFIDLFAGIGGFRIGMTAAGGRSVFSSEWDKYSCKTYSEWFNDPDIYTGDIRDVDISSIPDHDVLCAGFPCQPFSIAGVSKKNSLGRTHGFQDAQQGNLFFSIMDIVDIKRPPVLLLENVKNLKSHDKGNTWKVIEKNLIDRDYSVFHKIIDARNWVPQHRERIFIVCFDKQIFGNEYNIDFSFPEVEGEHRLDEILSTKAPDKKYMLSDKLWKYLQDYAKKHKAKGNGFGFGLFDENGVARTLSARYYKDGSEILIKQKGWRNPRRLTPQEAANLMGFDDSYADLWNFEDGFPQVVSDTQAYKQFGNAVVPKVVEAISHNIVHAMGSHVFKAGNGCLLKDRAFAS